MTFSSAETAHGPQGSFVGRERELAELRSALEETPTHSHLFLISGEPGIGKTRLADELATQARRRGLRVFWGRCWEGGGTPAYWPFIQIVRACLEPIESGRSILKSEIAAEVAAEVAQIVPELRPARGDEPPASKSVDMETSRFRLFDAVATFFKTLAHKSPILIVVDDLHDADLASLAMLGFVARAVHDARIMIVGTYRDAEMRRFSERLKLVEEILREGEQLPLTGLAKSEVGHMVEARAGQPASEALVEKLHWLTSGNPLFIDGVVRVLAGQGKLKQVDAVEIAALKLPDNIRAAIGNRLAMISEEARSVLAKAATIGQEFEPALLAEVSGSSIGSLSRTMIEANELGIIVQTVRDHYRFSHPLIRQSLYQGQQDAERISAHLAIGGLLEQMHGKNSGTDAEPWPYDLGPLRQQATNADSIQAPHLAALAYHFREAGDNGKGVDYSVRAGKSAYRVYAYEAAVSQWQTALALMDAQGGGDKPLRAHILRALNDNMLWGFVSQSKVIEYLESAAQLYKELGDDERCAEAHSELGINLSMHLEVRNPERSKYHFREAETLLAGRPDSLAKAVFYNTKCGDCDHSMRTKEGLDAARRVMEIADRPEWKTQWYWAAMFYSSFLVYRGRLAEGLELASQLLRHGLHLLDPPTASTVAIMCGRSYALLGDPREAQGWWEPELLLARTASSSHQRAELHGSMGHARLEQGDLVGARRHFSEAGGSSAELAQWEGEWERSEEILRRRFDRAKATEDRMNEMLTALGLARVYQCSANYLRAEQFAKSALSVAVEGEAIAFELLDRAWSILILEAAGKAHEAIPHLDRCREILREGEDWRGRAGLVACAEGVMAAAQGRYREAEPQFEEAITVLRRYSLRSDEAEAIYCYGRALLAAGESRRANEKFDAAIEIYRRHGAGQRWIDRVESARAASRPSPIEGDQTGAAGIGESAQGPAIFKREGEFWTLAYRGSTFHLKDIKGLGYIAFLLAHPGDRIHVHELISRTDGVSSGNQTPATVSHETPTTDELGDAGSVLDRRAQSDYRRRLRELAEDLAEAERHNDIGRAESIRNEQDFLTGELSAAFGIGGRERKVAAQAERVRSMVSKRIRASMEKIRNEDAILGRYLAASIKTGYYCAYLPDPERKISWQL